jgi:hypothetical protein
MRIKLAASAAAVVALVALVAWRGAGRPSKPVVTGVSAPTSKLAELQAELSRLEGRLARNERTADDLTLRVGSAATTTSGTPVAARPDDVEEAAVPVRPPRPSLEQQVARFEKHFANLDALRGVERDPTLETKFRELLTNEAALKLGSLTKLKIEEISCGNRFCRVDVHFDDPGVARLGQTEMQIQLAPLSSGATIYMDPGTSKLHAYFATGDERLPGLPSLEETAL